MKPTILTLTIFNAATVGASGYTDSVVIDLSEFHPHALTHGLQVTSVGAGSQLTFTPYFSNDNDTWAPGTDIATGFTPGSDLLDFSRVEARYMKIRATETAGNAVTSLTGILSIR